MMKTQQLRRLVSACAAILVLHQSYLGVCLHRRDLPAGASQNQLAGFPFVPADEEITALVPAPATVLIRRANYAIKEHGERVLASRVYSGYGNGVVFIIQSYKAEHPQNLWGVLLEQADKSAVFERDISFDGVTARQYRSDYSSSYAKYTRRFVRFMTREHVYLLTLTTLDETNSTVEQFLASFHLRRPEDRVTPPATPSSEYTPVNVLSGNEVTRKAIVVWKPEPNYTDQARAHQVAGTVILEAILVAEGYVANITVTKELKDGLTERAIEAAQSIRFFPAEKDGKPVSQRIQLHYSFNVF